MKITDYETLLTDMETKAEEPLKSVIVEEREALQKLTRLLPHYRTEEFERFIAGSKERIEKVMMG